jgi:hypothetical protein
MPFYFEARCFHQSPAQFQQMIALQEGKDYNLGVYVGVAGPLKTLFKIEV